MQSDDQRIHRGFSQRRFNSSYRHSMTAVLRGREDLVRGAIGQQLGASARSFAGPGVREKMANVDCDRGPVLPATLYP